MSNQLPSLAHGQQGWLKTFQTLKAQQFNGRFVVRHDYRKQWVFYFYLGRLLYATGGLHPVRRWQRHLNATCPSLDIAQLSALGSAHLPAASRCWEYHLLREGSNSGLLSREQLIRLIGGMVSDVVLEISQSPKCGWHTVADRPLEPCKGVLLDPVQFLDSFQQQWQHWQWFGIEDCKPDCAIAIANLQSLQAQMSPQAFQAMTELLDGESTLFEIAQRTGRKLTDLANSLMPLIRSKILRWQDLSDAKPPIGMGSTPKPQSQPSLYRQTIACVDDSPMVCQVMEKILTKEGYQFVGVTESLRAIATLLAKKPDLIFLDLVMPNTNGYEICSQLRSLSVFKRTPIIILTGNDGLVDRVRAKLVGSTEFLSKPVSSSTVLEVVKQYLTVKV
ncbi:response regulator [Synechococcus sp. PCC 7336]|uniref:response regulator n=1 Tax=Synechococcus sp. PCC 7336 TaxID=195250 RepID=UPI0003462998|nr:response regulator [Synechococcus sp. PCC 7336]